MTARVPVEDRIGALEQAVVVLVAENAALRARLDAMAEEVVTRRVRVVGPEGSLRALLAGSVEAGELWLCTSSGLERGPSACLLASDEYGPPLASLTLNVDNKPVAGMATDDEEEEVQIPPNTQPAA